MNSEMIDFTMLVSNNEASEQNYNLFVSTYVEQKDPQEIAEIKELNAEIERIASREDVLRREINVIIAERDLPALPVR